MSNSEVTILFWLKDLKYNNKDHAELGKKVHREWDQVESINISLQFMTFSGLDTLTGRRSVRTYSLCQDLRLRDNRPQGEVGQTHSHLIL